jgi:predicted homoserine dehydrogenase-like protein
VYLAELQARAADPIRVGIVGVGRMGRGIVDQISTMTGMRIVAAADVDRERAVRSFTDNSWERDQVTLASTPAEGDEALRRGRVVAAESPELIPDLEGIEVVVEATGIPAVGALVALRSIEHGHHVVMLNVETDAIVGSILARRAHEAGVVYTLAAGDQPGAIFELVEWSRTLGFEIVCAGRGTVFFPHDHRATPETYADIAERNRMNPKMYNEFRDGTKAQLEMVAVSNVLKMPPAVRGMHEPFCSWPDLGRMFSLVQDGGILEEPGVIDMANSVNPSGEYVHEEKVFPGIFAVVTSPHAGVRSSMGSLFEPGYGGREQQWGPNWGLFRPYHLACVEVPMSVARAAIQGRPTGELSGGPVAELVAVAKRDLRAGDELDGGGGYTVYGLSERYDNAARERLLPFGFAYAGTRVTRDVARDEPISLDDVMIERENELTGLRAEQDRLFAPEGIAT